MTLADGSHTVTLTVDDGRGGIASDDVVVVVADTTPPTIQSLTASPNILWPPNGRLVSVNVTALASDSRDAAPVCQIVSVNSSELVNGLGDGNTSPDWVMTGDLAVDLRAERSGRGIGRTYDISVQCTDASGNASTAIVNVGVPHDQRKR